MQETKIKKRFHLYKSYLPTTYEPTQVEEEEEEKIDAVTISRNSPILTFLEGNPTTTEERRVGGEMRSVIGLSPNIRRDERRQPEEWNEAGEKRTDAGGGRGRHRRWGWSARRVERRRPNIWSIIMQSRLGTRRKAFSNFNLDRLITTTIKI